MWNLRIYPLSKLLKSLKCRKPYLLALKARHGVCTACFPPLCPVILDYRNLLSWLCTYTSRLSTFLLLKCLLFKCKRLVWLASSITLSVVKSNLVILLSPTNGHFVITHEQNFMECTLVWVREANDPSKPECQENCVTWV